MNALHTTLVKLILPLVILVLVSVIQTGKATADQGMPPVESGEKAEEDELDDLFDQFDDDEVISEGEPDGSSTSLPPSGQRDLPYSFGGELSLSMASNFAHDPPESGQTDWRGLSRLRSMLALEADYDPIDSLNIHLSGYGFYDFAYTINGREQYTDEVLDDYEDEWELTETYVLFSPWSSFDFWFGRQIVVWGVSDNIRVTDVINPLDRREPGMTDLEYMRLPVTMSRVDYFFRQWRLSGAAIHEIRFSKNPAFGSDFYPYPTPLPPEDKPSVGWDHTQWVFSASRTFRGWDLALYAADRYNDIPHLQTADAGSDTPLIRGHARLRMFGAAADVAVGNWLIKSEAAWQNGFEHFNAPGETFSRFDLLFGVEYSGFRETTISFEVANRHINGFSDALRETPDHGQPNTFQSALRIVREFLNDSLTCTLLAMTYGPLGQDGAFQRLQVEYDLRDNLEITGGVVRYQSGDLPQFEKIGDNDRVFVDVTYHF